MKKTVFFLFLAAISHYLSAQSCQQPRAAFTYHIANDGVTVSFDAEPGCVPGVDILWTFGDGGTSSGNLTTEHTYAEEGTYIVRLKLTAPPPCNNDDYYSIASQTIVISFPTPQSLWADISGPTLAAECQAVTYSVNVKGGVPPYTYHWNMGDGYQTDPAGCPNAPCSETTHPACEFSTLDPTQTGTFSASRPTGNSITVEVTDAIGNYTIVSMHTVVKAGLQPLEFFVNGTDAPSCGSGMFPTGSMIQFSPDVEPMSSLTAPVTYTWNFGDGTIVTDDEYGGSGYVVHTYQNNPSPNFYPRTYDVKLTVTDQNGSMQASKLVTICSANPNSNSSTACSVGFLNQAVEFYNMEYSGSSSYTSLQLYGEPTGQECFMAPQNYQWKFTFNDCHFPTTTGSSSIFTFTTVNQSSVDLDISDPNSFWNTNSYGYQPWGNVSVSCDNSGGYPVGSNNCCSAPLKKCLFIQPPKLHVDEVTFHGQCDNYTFKANVSGGAWSSIDVNGNKVYKNDYSWQAFDDNTHEDISQQLFLNPSEKGPEIAINPSIYKNKPPYFSPGFLVKVTVRDKANQQADRTEYITIDPFRVNLVSAYTRCPLLPTIFDYSHPLAVDGTGPYTYLWSNGLTGASPTFTAPANGATATYSLTVTDATGCSITATTTVTGKNLAFSLPANVKNCNTSGLPLLIGLTYNQLKTIGGSGDYAFLWESPSGNIANLDKNYSEIAKVSALPPGVTATFTLKLTDLYSGCTATATTTVTTVANNVAISLPATLSTCYGDPLMIQATIPGVHGLPQGFTCTWQHPTFPERAPLSSGTDGLSINLTEEAANFPGTFPFTARLVETETGCYAEANTSITIRDNWQVDGYKPVVKSVIQGTSVPLWEGYGNPNTNRITTPLISNPVITWSGTTPNNLTYYNRVSGIPTNGKFIPATTMPFLTMKVKDLATGCEKSFNSVRYLISEQAPEMWISTAKSVICAGDQSDHCFEIVFDAHLANYLTTLTPLKVRVRITVLPPSVLPPVQGQAYTPFKPTLVDYISLRLDERTGLYKGTYCNKNYFEYYGSGECNYYCSASLISDPVYGNIESGEVGIEVQQSSVSTNNIPDKQCVTASGALIRKINYGLGYLPCDGVTANLMNTGAKVMAKDYIEIVPDGQVLIAPVNNDNYRFLIAECISPQRPDDAKGRTQDSLEQTANELPVIPEENKTNLEMDIHPNPFDQSVAISFTIATERPVGASLDIFDIAGHNVRNIEKYASLTTGVYNVKHNTADLPPGTYIYRLSLYDGRRISQIKIKM